MSSIEPGPAVAAEEVDDLLARADAAPLEEALRLLEEAYERLSRSLASLGDDVG